MRRDAFNVMPEANGVSERTLSHTHKMHHEWTFQSQVTISMWTRFPRIFQDETCTSAFSNTKKNGRNKLKLNKVRWRMVTVMVCVFDLCKQLQFALFLSFSSFVSPLTQQIFLWIGTRMVRRLIVIAFTDCLHSDYSINAFALILFIRLPFCANRCSIFYFLFFIRHSPFNQSIYFPSWMCAVRTFIH